MSADKLRAAVVGLGIGMSHVSAYFSVPDQFQLVAVCDIDAAKGQPVADALKIDFTPSLDELCARDDLDVIDICTPPYLHRAHIEQVLASGKHAICEKPLVSSLLEVDELKVIQAQSGKYIMPIFQYRFGHGLQKLKFLVDRGLAGQAYATMVDTAWKRGADYYAIPWRGKWQTELGGALMTHAIHAHDMLTYIVGPIANVFARTSTRVNPIEVEDCASVSLEMADGSLASMSVTLGSAVEITRHRFCFSNLTAESNTQPYTNSHDPWTFSGYTPEATAQIDAALRDFVPLPEHYAGQFYRFYQTVTTGAPLPVTLDDARASIELLAAMYYSARTGEAVALPLGNDHPYYAGWLP
ncbi:MAG: Gfo/Idh/MocA family oxidoreductase [Anaerolineae bacterium]